MLNWLLSFFGRVWCDRCHRAVEGDMSSPMGAGVYIDWEFNRPGEYIVCDKCMWSDEGYLAVYPYMRGHGH